MTRKAKVESLRPGDEITISYGGDKPAAEFLFNYGFVQEDDYRSTLVERGQSLMMPLDASSWENWARDDPFLAAKLELFRDAPMLRLTVDQEGVASWTCPFVYLLSVGEEDGFDFTNIQKGDETSGWTLLWRGKDITCMVGMLGRG